MIKLDKNLLEVDVEAQTWRESVESAGNLLLGNALIEPEYIDSMIETVEEHGPYMILAPKICFFHGKPGKNVKEPCISLITLKDEVRFTEFEDQPFNCAFAFGATDSDSHLNLLQEITTLLKDDEFTHLITNNGNKNLILNKIEELLK